MRTLLLLFCLSAVANAQAGVRSYQRNDGTVVRAEINRVDRDRNRVEYTFFAGGGSGRTIRSLAEFVPQSQFNILRAMLGDDDVEGRVQLAAFAVDNGLIAAGQRELFKARDIANNTDIAPELESRIMDEAVKALDGLLRGLLDEGKLKDANYILHEILAGERITEPQKAQFTRLVANKSRQIENAAARDRATARTARLSAERERQLKPLQDRLQRGKSLEQRALQNLSDQSQARSAYNRAVRDFDYVIGAAERLADRHSDDSDFTAELASLSRQAQDDKISSLLSLASIYTTRGSFNDAMGAVGQVLAMDSQNRQALNMRARIEIAANSDNGYIGGRTLGRPTGRIR